MGKDKKLRLLFCIDRLAVGGAERAVSIFSSQLVDLSYDVGILTFHKSDKDYQINPKVEVICKEPEWQNINNRLQRIKLRQQLIDDAFEEFKPDLVLLFLTSMVIEGTPVALKKKICTVGTFRGSLEAESRIKQIMFKWSLSKCHSIFLQTEAQRRYFKKSIVNKSFVVSNPFSYGLLDRKYEKQNYSHAYKWISVGRLEKGKHFDSLIKVITRLHKEFSEISLDIFGIGSEAEKLAHLINMENASKFIRLMGWTDHIECILGKYDAFVMNSESEGLPNALLEAMAVGLPCISTNCPTGPQELIGNNERGLLVPVRDGDELEKAIRKYIENYNLAEINGKKARAYILDNYSPEILGKQLSNELIKIYQKRERYNAYKN